MDFIYKLFKRSSRSPNHEENTFNQTTLNSLIKKSEEIEAPYLEDSNFEILGTKGTPPSERYAHVSVETSDSIIIFGGYNNNCRRYYNDLFEFTFHDAKWIKHEVTGDVPPTLGCHSAVLYGTSMFCFGGYNGDIANTCNTLYEYRIEERRWKKINHKNPPSERSYHLSFVRGDSMVVYGGYVLTDDTRIHYFNFNDHKWTSKQTRGSCPSFVAKTYPAFYNNCMYIFGGNRDWWIGTSSADFFCLDLNSLIWTKVESSGSIPSNRYSHSVVVIEDQMFLYGGTNTYKKEGVFNDFYVFNFLTKQWNKYRTNQSKRFWHTSICRNNCMYIICGTDSEIHYNDILVIKLPKKSNEYKEKLRQSLYMEHFIDVSFAY